MYPQIPIAEGFALSTYFFTISLATTISLLWFLRRAEHNHLSRVTAIDLALTVLTGGFLGARLLHIFYEEPEIYRINPVAALQVWNGGFVFLGGVAGALAASVAFCRIKKEPFWYWADVATLPVSLGYAMGRIACFLNGCCYGRAAEVPWAVHLHGSARHPTQIYASVWEFLLLTALFRAQNRFKTSGMLFNTWLLFHSFGRIVMELFRADPRGDLLFNMSIGTVMSLALISWALSNMLLRKG